MSVLKVSGLVKIACISIVTVLTSTIVLAEQTNPEQITSEFPQRVLKTSPLLSSTVPKVQERKAPKVIPRFSSPKRQNPLGKPMGFAGPLPDIRITPLDGNLVPGAVTDKLCGDMSALGEVQNIKFRLKNFGGPAPSNFVVAVHFSGQSGPAFNAQLMINGLPPGVIVTRTITIPGNAFPVDDNAVLPIGFKLTADATNQIVESNEANNKVIGTCALPIPVQ
ncbi:MAG: CARDB domain-containing protein [Halopseudomonas aestusnigri]